MEGSGNELLGRREYKPREVAGAKMRESENIDGQETQGDAREEWREEK